MLRFSVPLLDSWNFFRMEQNKKLRVRKTFLFLNLAILKVRIFLFENWAAGAHMR